jgi:hypothetical protein
MGRSNAHIVLNSRDATQGSYNQLTFNAINQNIIQGNIDRIGLNEVNFPYDIPNVQEGFNEFLIFDLSNNEIDIAITPGFYTGSLLKDAINAAIVAYGQTQDPVLVADDLPSFDYKDGANLFKFVAPVTQSNAIWYLQSANVSAFPSPPIPGSPQQLYKDPLGKDLLLIMGFQPEQDTYVTNHPGPNNNNTYRFAGGSAPLTFTQYIDICSPQLCKFQYFRDGSTTNLSRRTDVICRLYVSNNIAVTEQEGSRPFVINRQYQNARVMKWTADNAVGTIDINLYDDCGRPLQTTWVPRNYQITFNCYEKSEDVDEQGVPRYPAYINRNERAWNNLAHQ